MKLSILVPVFNEEDTIREVIAKLLSVKVPWQKEIIIIDDGSTDKTKDFLVKLSNKRKGNIKVIFHKSNQGKGKAIQSGIKSSRGDYLLIQDADLEYDPLEINKLLIPISKGKADDKTAVYGSRFKLKRPKISPVYYFGNRLLTIFTNILFASNLTDMETGYKLVPAKFMKCWKFKSKRFDIEPEITAKLIKSGINIIEVPISYKGRSHLAGKKLTIRDAFAAIKTLVYFRFAP